MKQRGLGCGCTDQRSAGSASHPIKDLIFSSFEWRRNVACSTNLVINPNQKDTYNHKLMCRTILRLVGTVLELSDSGGDGSRTRQLGLVHNPKGRK